MKYKNAKNIFPDDILEELQKYVQGEYVYILKLPTPKRCVEP